MSHKPISFQTLWNSINAKPKPKITRDENGKKVIDHFTSFPWDGKSGTFEHQGKPHIVITNPWVVAYTFKQIAKPEMEGKA